jgi:hypothetical protein
MHGNPVGYEATHIQPDTIAFGRMHDVLLELIFTLAAAKVSTTIM